MSGERKGLTENELKKLRARFKRRQNKFAAITAVPLPCDEHDDEEVFENVIVDISPISADTNEWQLPVKEQPRLTTTVNEALPRKRKEGRVSKKNPSPQPKSDQTPEDENPQITKNLEPISRLNCSKSSTKARKNPISKSTASASSSVSLEKRRDSNGKSSGNISLLGSNIDKKKSDETRPKKGKLKVTEGKGERKEQKNKETKKGKGTERYAKLEGKKVAFGSSSKAKEKLVETSGKLKMKSEQSRPNSTKSFLRVKTTSISSENNLQSTTDADLLLKPIEMAKKDQLLYEKMDDEIILDTNVLQSLATELVKECSKVNKDVIGEDIAKKLIEIEEKDQSSIEQDQIREENEIVVSEIAKRIVEALTCSHVLGKVLTPEEASILRDYFSRKIRLSEQVLATLDTALDKILRRAHEFYNDKKELDTFLNDRDSAKARLLDALIAKKSNYLADLMTDASFYADQISKGLIDVYKLATEGILVARDNFQYMQAAVGHTYRYSKDMAYRGATLTYETAARGKQLAEIGATVGAQMTCDAAKITLDAAARGKDLAEHGANIGTKMTCDAAKMTLDVAVRGKELAERSAAIGTKMTSDAAKMTCDVTNRGKELAGLGIQIGARITQDAASKGLEIAEGTIQAASKGTEMVKEGLSAARNATFNLSETVLESAVQATKMVQNVGEKVTASPGAMSQARPEIQKPSEWLLSFFQPFTMTSEKSNTTQAASEDNDSSDDDSEGNEIQE